MACSSYYDVSQDDAHLTIGYALFRREVWRDVANAEAKLLMLSYAFDVRMSDVPVNAADRATTTRDPS